MAAETEGGTLMGKPTCCEAMSTASGTTHINDDNMEGKRQLCSEKKLVGGIISLKDNFRMSPPDDADLSLTYKRNTNLTTNHLGENSVSNLGSECVDHVIFRGTGVQDVEIMKRNVGNLNYVSKKQKSLDNTLCQIAQPLPTDLDSETIALQYCSRNNRETMVATEDFSQQILRHQSGDTGTFNNLHIRSALKQPLTASLQPSVTFILLHQNGLGKQTRHDGSLDMNVLQSMNTQVINKLCVSSGIPYFGLPPSDVSLSSVTKQRNECSGQTEYHDSYDELKVLKTRCTDSDVICCGVDVSSGGIVVSYSDVDVSSSVVGASSMAIDVDNSGINLSNNYVNIYNSCGTVSSSCIDISRSSVDESNSDYDVNNIGVNVSSGSSDLISSDIHVSSSGVDFLSTDVHVKNNDADISGSVIDVISSSPDVSSCDIDSSSSVVDVSSCGIDASNDGIDLSSSVIDVSSSVIDVSSSVIDVRSSVIDVSSSGIHVCGSEVHSNLVHSGDRVENDINKLNINTENPETAQHFQQISSVYHASSKVEDIDRESEIMAVGVKSNESQTILNSVKNVSSQNDLSNSNIDIEKLIRHKSVLTEREDIPICTTDVYNNENSTSTLSLDDCCHSLELYSVIKHAHSSDKRTNTKLSGAVKESVAGESNINVHHCVQEMDNEISRKDTFPTACIMDKPHILTDKTSQNIIDVLTASNCSASQKLQETTDLEGECFKDYLPQNCSSVEILPCTDPRSEQNCNRLEVFPEHDMSSNQSVDDNSINGNPFVESNSRRKNIVTTDCTSSAMKNSDMLLPLKTQNHVMNSGTY